MTDNRIESFNGGMAFVGREAVNVFAMTAIASALELYARTGMKASRTYTPSAMLAAATRYTGKMFKRGQYLEAAQALREAAKQSADNINAEGDQP